ASSVEVYPPIIQIRAVGPVSLQTPILIKNSGDKNEVFKISIKPFTQTDEQNGKIRYLKDEEFSPTDPLILQRIKVLEEDKEVSQLELGPKQQKQLKLIIDIPSGETASDYYFSLLFTSTLSEYQSETDQPLVNKNRSDILTAIATNVLLSTGEEEKPNIEIEEFSTTLLKQNGTINFQVKASNLGNQFASVKGHILITNLFGKAVGRVDLTPVNILSGTSRFIPSQGEISKAVWKENLIAGLYTATLSLQFGENGHVVKETTHLIGAPVNILTISLIVIFMLLLIRNKLKHRLKR
ncbi:MAG: hypothetical protein WD967_01285, partial [Candidatus Levyibacteriota bacterium]